jgi:thymidylate synthase (FAD)
MRAEYMNHMGDDLTVVDAARVSFSKRSAWNAETGDMEERDAKLIRSLARRGHWTPFAHPQISLRMGAPVPIRTQCFKHKQGFAENEESRRYIKSTPELFVPDHFRAKPDGSIKQGSGGEHPDSDFWMRRYLERCMDSIDTYENMIADDVCPEQARFVLPQGVIVNWVWTGSLAAFARFYAQRSDSHAQKEIQELAERVGEIIAPLFPISWDALTS